MRIWASCTEGSKRARRGDTHWPAPYLILPDDQPKFRGTKLSMMAMLLKQTDVHNRTPQKATFRGRELSMMATLPRQVESVRMDEGAGKCGQKRQKAQRSIGPTASKAHPPS